MRETWYVLEDGNVADPNDCIADEKGRLTHKSGVRVAMRFADCPMSRGVDVDRGGPGSNPAAKRKPEEPSGDSKELKPEEPRKGYKTREAKAD